MDIVRPKALVIPSITKAIRDTMAAEPGTLLYNSDDKILYISTTNVVGSTSWSKITQT